MSGQDNTDRPGRITTVEHAEVDVSGVVALPAGWVRDPLPEGDVQIELPLQLCDTCGQALVHEDSRRWLTRTAEPDPVSGLYQVQLHHDWCPAFTGQLEELGCTECGAPIHRYTLRLGYSFPVRDPLSGRIKHLVGTDEVLSGSRAHVAAGYQPTREVDFDELEVEPCGHVLTGSDAHRALAAIKKIRAVRQRAAVEATIAAQQRLLEAVENAGHTVVADAYRRAVFAGSRHADGLLEALRLLCPADSAGAAAS